jgi:hypothetical protein
MTKTVRLMNLSVFDSSTYCMRDLSHLYLQLFDFHNTDRPIHPVGDLHRFGLSEESRVQVTAPTKKKPTKKSSPSVAGSFNWM